MQDRIDKMNRMETGGIGFVGSQFICSVLLPGPVQDGRVDRRNTYD